MIKKALIIVGDEYAALAKHEGVYSVSQVWHELSLPADMDIDQVYFGLGVDETECSNLNEALLRRGARCIEGLASLVETKLTHKVNRAHVLVAGGQRLRERSYAYDLFLDTAQDRLCDHVTGQHVSGMLLMEAGRQAATVSLGQQYPSKPSHEWEMVLENITASFSNYAFPIPTSIRVDISENSEPTEKQIDVSIFLIFRQVEQDICNIRFDVKLCEKGMLLKIEDRKARRVIDTLLSKHYAESV